MRSFYKKICFFCKLLELCNLTIGKSHRDLGHLLYKRKPTIYKKKLTRSR